MCMCGEGGVKDFERAIGVLTVAAKNDNLKAMIELAQLYEKNGDFKNTERSLFWRQRSEERAREVLGKKLDSKACLEIAQIFKSGKYVDTLGSLRSDGYQEISDVWSGTGCADMCYSLAKSSSDEKEKISWLLRASLLENVYAQIDLANYYLYEAKLAGNAAYWYYRVAENGLAEGQWMVGVLLKLGLGVGKDLHRAVDFYKKAALSGYVRAMVRCILLTMSNKICYDDSIVKIFDELSSSDNVEALTILGDCYKIGFYVDKDIIKAKELYKTVSKEGSGYAAFRICEILELEGADIRKELEELSRFGCGEACEKLGDIKWKSGEESAAIIDYWRSINYGYLSVAETVCSILDAKARSGSISFSDNLKYEQIKVMFTQIKKSGKFRYNLSLLDFQMKSLVRMIPKDIDTETDIFYVDKPCDQKRFCHLDDWKDNIDEDYEKCDNSQPDWAEESGWNDMYGGGCDPSDFIDYD